MQFCARLCVILLYIQATTTSSLIPNPINNILLRKIESIRLQMPCGINGGPGLVPFREEFVDATYENSTIFRISGFLQDIQVDNLDKFVVNNIDFTLLHLKLDFGFTLPNMIINGLYNMTGKYFNRVVQIWGNGPFTIEFNDLQLSGSLRLRIANGFLDMTELQVVLSLNSLNSDISGILDDEQSSLYFNMMIESLMPQLMDTYSIDIGQAISTHLIRIANEFLHNLTLSDIIGGGNDNDKPCNPKY